MNAKQIIARYNAGERDFRRLNLRGMNFKGANLSGADFSECDCQSANFSNAILSKINLERSNLKGTKFIKSNLRDGNLSYIKTGIDTCAYIQWSMLAMIIFYVEHLIQIHINKDLWYTVIAFWLLVFHQIGLLLRAILETFYFLKYIIGTISSLLPKNHRDKISHYLINTIKFLSNSFRASFLFLTPNIEPFPFLCFVLFTAAFFAVFGAWILIPSYFLSKIGLIYVEEPEAWMLWIVILFLGSRDKSLIKVFSLQDTSFEGSDLKSANFASASLISVDLTKTNINLINWKNCFIFDAFTDYDSFLNDLDIKQLLVYGDISGNKNIFRNRVDLKSLNLSGLNLSNIDFSGSNLSGCNFYKANLADANLMTTNLNDADLQDADLSRAKLVQTQLDNADLTGTTLTGACIEDWGITVDTVLNGIHCDYVYMRFIDGDKRRRKPDGEDTNFAEGEFVEFIKPLVDTLDLYHVTTKDPRIVSIALSEFQENNPDLNFDIISIERRGKHLEDLLLRLKIWGQADLSALHSQYFDIYQALASLPFEKVNKEISQLFKKVMESAERSVSNNFFDTKNVNQFFNTQTAIMGDQILEQQNIQGDNVVNQGDTYSNNNIGVAGRENKIESGAIAAGQYNAAQKQTLAEAATEIRDLLTRLESEYGNQTTMEKMTVATEVIREINANPTLAQRIYSAIKAGGVAALDSFLDRPETSFVIAALQDWYDNAPEP